MSLARQSYRAFQCHGLIFFFIPLIYGNLMCAPSTLLSWSGQTLLRSFSPSHALAAPTGEGGWKVEDGREGNASE